MPMMHKMWMYFHGETNDTILFSFWCVQTPLGMFLSCLFLFFSAICFEFLKWFRLVLEQQMDMANSRNGQQQQQQQRQEEMAAVIPIANRRYSNSLLSASHLVQCGLFLVQLLLSYLLMLAVMTFSIWILLAVCSGAAFGFWLFGRRQPVFGQSAAQLH